MADNHVHEHERWRHHHRYSIDAGHAERRTGIVLWLTVVTMAVEIAAGAAYNSMALLADGWHMGTHAAALGIAVFAYRWARRHADDTHFTFGTGKVGALGGFASAVFLAVVSFLMIAESVHRLLRSEPIGFDEAIIVAVIGLIVNLASALLLEGGGQSHAHDHSHAGHDHPHPHAHDHNLRAAYIHVLADAFTSVLAIVALVIGKFVGWVWLDPAMGLVGAAIILRWAYGLVRDTAMVLLDSRADQAMVAAIHAAIENEPGNTVSDLHVWPIAPGQLAAIVSVVTHDPRPPVHYKDLLTGIEHLAHVTVEVNRCSDPPPPAQGK